MRYQCVKPVVAALLGPMLLGYAPSATAQVAPSRSQATFTTSTKTLPPLTTACSR